MGETCPRCGRIRAESFDEYWVRGECGDHLPDVYDDECRRLEVAAAYRRGIDEGVRLAKEYSVVTTYPDGSYEEDWTDVDAAAAKAKGGAA